MVATKCDDYYKARQNSLFLVSIQPLEQKSDRKNLFCLKVIFSISNITWGCMVISKVSHTGIDWQKDYYNCHFVREWLGI